MDRYRIVNPAYATAPHGGVTRPANGARHSQMREQLPLKYVARLDKLTSVDRFVVDPLFLIIRTFVHQPNCNFFRGPFARQLG